MNEKNKNQSKNVYTFTEYTEWIADSYPVASLKFILSIVQKKTNPDKVRYDFKL